VIVGNSVSVKTTWARAELHTCSTCSAGWREELLVEAHVGNPVRHPYILKHVRLRHLSEVRRSRSRFELLNGAPRGPNRAHVPCFWYELGTGGEINQGWFGGRAGTLSMLRPRLEREAPTLASSRRAEAELLLDTIAA